MRRIRYLVWASVFAALIICGAYISIPLSFTPVPIVLQNLFVLLCGLTIGAWWGAISVLLYLVLGAIGLPVFAAGSGGIAHILGPTGGYLIGFLPSVVITGLISHLSHRKRQRTRSVPAIMTSMSAASAPAVPRRSLALDIVAAVLGTAVVYVCGIPWLMRMTDISFTVALTLGLLPFLIGDLIKISLAVVVVRFFPSRRPFST